MLFSFSDFLYAQRSSPLLFFFLPITTKFTWSKYSVGVDTHRSQADPCPLPHFQPASLWVTRNCSELASEFGGEAWVKSADALFCKLYNFGCSLERNLIQRSFSPEYEVGRKAVYYYNLCINNTSSCKPVFSFSCRCALLGLFGNPFSYFTEFFTWFIRKQPYITLSI